MFVATRCAAFARWALAMLVVVFATTMLHAQESKDCLGCHSDNELVAERDGRKVSMYFDEDAAKKGLGGLLEGLFDKKKKKD